MYKVGGSMEAALKGEYVINVKNVLTEAWQLTLSSRKNILIPVLFVFSIILLLTLLMVGSFETVDEFYQDPTRVVMVNIVVTILSAPFLAAIDMIGVYKSIGANCHYKILFSFVNKITPLALCAMLTSILISLGLNLLILPGVLLFVALLPTVPLMIDKNLSPLKAIVVSIKATRYQLLPLFFMIAALFFALILIMLPLSLLINTPLSIVGVVLFFLLLSYLIPMFYYVKGIIYREIFGLYVTDKPQSVIGSFSA